MRSVTVALCLVALVFGQEAERPQVKTSNGMVKGSTSESRDGRMFYSFQGIPYGKAQRFQVASNPDKWEEVKDVSTPGNECIQLNPFSKKVNGEEDCLNVNVFTPRLPKEGQDKILLPVVVYIHPGFNMIGGNDNFDPKYFMDEDVIFVVPNFRLGVFGFLNTGDMYAQGNFGLKDQVLALKWVQENIEQFGGDKGRVTIFGSGYGASDAFIHTVSPQSKGLIHNTIAMGGSTLSRIAITLDPIKQAKKLGQQIGCPTESSQSLVMCLKGKDAKEILEKMTKLEPQEFNNNDFAWFGPSVEKPLEGQTENDLVLPDNPIKLLKEGKIVNKVPLIIGANDHQGIMFLNEDYLKEKSLLEKLDKQWNELAPELFMYKDTAKDKDVVSAKLREFYFGDKAISKDTFDELSGVFTDRFVGIGLIVQAMYYSKAAPVYMYLLKHKPEHTKLEYLGIKDNFGMAHLDELQYLFKLNIKPFDYPEITKSSTEFDLSHQLVKTLSGFAENGKPTKIWGDAKEWKKIEAGEPATSKFFIFGNNTTAHTVLPEVFGKRVAFWMDMYAKELGQEKLTPVEKF